MTDLVDPAPPPTLAPSRPTLFGYPVTWPKLGDPRLHVAAVILTVHLLGQVGLDFRVSLPQIAAAIGSAFLVDLLIVFVRDRQLVWPASAMLTGSGVALILRLGGMEANQPWSFDRWWWFAGISVASLLTKHVIQYRGTHVFNPSNLGLVAAFVMLGMERIEPLDFWWGEMSIWLVLAYGAILGGGLFINARLGLLDMLAAYYGVLLLGIGALAISGHCMTVPWALAPVCDLQYGEVVLTSPETMVFLLFMISDPKTIPSTRLGRLLFGVAVGFVGVFLMAPQTTEFWTKVGLLGGLTICSAGRWLVMWWLGRSTSVADGGYGPAMPGYWSVRELSTLALAAMVSATAPAAIYLGRGALTVDPDLTGLPDVSQAVASVDPASLPTVRVSSPAITFDPELADQQVAQALAATLVEILKTENKFILDGNGDLLGVNHGMRLVNNQERLDALVAGDAITLTDYDFDSLDLLVSRPGSQSAARLAFEAEGTRTLISYRRVGDTAVETDRITQPAHRLLVLLETEQGSWLLVDDLDAMEPSDADE